MTTCYVCDNVVIDYITCDLCNKKFHITCIPINMQSSVSGLNISRCEYCDQSDFYIAQSVCNILACAQNEHGIHYSGDTSILEISNTRTPFSNSNAQSQNITALNLSTVNNSDSHNNNKFDIINRIKNIFVCNCELPKCDWKCLTCECCDYGCECECCDYGCEYECECCDCTCKCECCDDD